MSSTVDEETPLLSVKRTPLPWGQFSLILFVQLAEPLTSQVIYPFAPQLIRDIGITNGDETKVGYYVGILQSMFFVAQAMTVLHWSRLSDYIGRKPVILIGLFGVSLSMWCFGLSKTFFGLVLSRSLSGALNGNIGVIKSVMAELTDPSNVAQAFAYFPIAWCTGTTLGPMIGGYLSHPVDQLPELFGKVEFLKEYPYFLACAVPAAFAAVCWLLIFFCLRETVKNPTPVSRLFYSKRRERTLPLDCEQPISSTKPGSEKPLPLRALLTYRVLISAGNYASLSLTEIAFRAIQPVFLSTPVALGGLGLPPSKIGNILAIYGIFNGIFQVFFFAKINHLLGTKKTFVMGIACAVPAFILYPILSVLVSSYGINWFVSALVIVQALLPIGMGIAYGAVFIYITAAAPNRASLGATNGLSQMAVSVFRAIGPIAVNSLFSISLAKGYLGGFMVYYVLVALGCSSVWLGCHLPDKTWT